MQVIPLQAIPNQSVAVTLGGQSVRLRVYQNFYALFIDVSINEAPILQGAICLNQVRIVRSLYLGFIGDLVFIDNQGTSDPVFSGLGSRYSLVYLEASDL